MRDLALFAAVPLDVAPRAAAERATALGGPRAAASAHRLDADAVASTWSSITTTVAAAAAATGLAGAASFHRG